MDLGSNCSLVEESLVKEIYGKYQIDREHPNLRRFGNASVKPSGYIKGKVVVDDICAEINLVIVLDHYTLRYYHLPLPPCDIILGQTFTELPNLVMHKTSDNLIFYEAPDTSCC